MRFSSLCMIYQLVTLFHEGKHNCSDIFIHQMLHYNIEKMSHAIDWYFLTAGFANLSEKTLTVLGHLPTGMLLSSGLFFLFWQVRQESMRSFNICHHTQLRITFISFHALLFHYCEGTQRTLLIALQCCFSLPTCCNISIWKFTELQFSEEGDQRH